MRAHIIKALDLKPTKKSEIGESFRYDIKFYKDSLGNIYSMCDIHGRPSNLIFIQLYNGGAVMITEEVALDLPVLKVWLEEELQDRVKRLIQRTGWI